VDTEAGDRRLTAVWTSFGRRTAGAGAPHDIILQINAQSTPHYNTRPYLYRIRRVPRNTEVPCLVCRVSSLLRTSCIEHQMPRSITTSKKFNYSIFETVLQLHHQNIFRSKYLKKTVERLTADREDFLALSYDVE
jgi:hypothetical protein